MSVLTLAKLIVSTVDIEEIVDGEHGICFPATRHSYWSERRSQVSQIDNDDLWYRPGMGAGKRKGVSTAR